MCAGCQAGYKRHAASRLCERFDVDDEGVALATAPHRPLGSSSAVAADGLCGARGLGLSAAMQEGAGRLAEEGEAEVWDEGSGGAGAEPCGRRAGGSGMRGRGATAACVRHAATRIASIAEPCELPAVAALPAPAAPAAPAAPHAYRSRVSLA